MASFPTVPRTAVVTGCSTGIGLATARLLHGRGWKVFATARKPEDLEHLEQLGLHPVDVDLADAEQTTRAISGIAELADGQVGAVINNAGFGQPGALEDVSREALRAQFEVNVFAMHQLTQAFVGEFRQRGSGRIVNVSSVLGRVSSPLLGAYSASKFAVEALSDAQRVELAGSGVAVSIIEPGPIITAFRNRAMHQVSSQIDTGDSPFGPLFLRELERRQNAAKQENWINKPPEAVAEKILHAVESSRPKRRYCVTPPAYLGALLRRCAPYALLDAVMVKRIRKLQAAASAAASPTN